MTALNQVVTKAYGGKTYGDFVHFVHVYTVEAHPMTPDPSPYSGKVWELAYSELGNPLRYEGRVENAKRMKPGLAGTQLLLVDDLTPRSRNNPVWCTYGTCPNCTFLIRQDGTFHKVYTKSMRTAAEMEAALLSFLQ